MQVRAQLTAFKQYPAFHSMEHTIDDCCLDDSDDEKIEVDKEMVARARHMAKLMQQASDENVQSYLSHCKGFMLQAADSTNSLKFYTAGQIAPSNQSSGEDIENSCALSYIPKELDKLLPLAATLQSPQFLCLWVQPGHQNHNKLFLLTNSYETKEWVVSKITCDDLVELFQHMQRVLREKEVWTLADMLPIKTAPVSRGRRMSIGM
eukprot:TRINITY_DN65845_c2_g4_i1.p1 TRINITY_DN65845_c2_g4~~TRINITY_DN65845_c2_g4_i1.p1  ORF type:complete len:207 (+),score=10.72 TRINITY_DN65845_c2_g4_i1:36-656(+)